MVHTVFQKRRVVTIENKNFSIFEENYLPAKMKPNRTWAKKVKNASIYGIIVSTPHWLNQLT